MIDDNKIAKRLIELSVEYIRVFCKDNLFKCHFGGILKVLNSLLEIDIKIKDGFSKRIGDICENFLTTFDTKSCILEKIEIFRVLEKLHKEDIYNFENIFLLQKRDGSWENSEKNNDFVYTMQIIEELGHINDKRIQQYSDQIQMAYIFVENIWKNDLNNGNFIPFKAGKFIRASVNCSSNLSCIEQSVRGLLETQLECGGWSFFRKDKRSTKFLEYHCSIVDTLEVLLSLLTYQKSFETSFELKEKVDLAINNAYFYAFNNFTVHGWKSQDNFQYARILALGVQVYNKMQKFVNVREILNSV